MANQLKIEGDTAIFINAVRDEPLKIVAMVKLNDKIIVSVGEHPLPSTTNA
jgi:hypothetical protein